MCQVNTLSFSLINIDIAEYMGFFDNFFSSKSK